MAGKIHRLIDTILEKRSGGSPIIRQTTRTKLILKGINPDAYPPDAPDDPKIVERLFEIASAMGVELGGVV